MASFSQNTTHNITKIQVKRKRKTLATHSTFAWSLTYNIYLDPLMHILPKLVHLQLILIQKPPHQKQLDTKWMPNIVKNTNHNCIIVKNNLQQTNQRKAKDKIYIAFSTFTINCRIFVTFWVSMVDDNVPSN